MTVTYEEVLQHLLEAHGEHLRTTLDPLSLGDFVTVNYVNPLYARATARPEGAIGRLERFVASGGDTEVLLEGLPRRHSSGWDPALVAAINNALLDRGAGVQVEDLSNDLWDRFMGPMLDAIESGEWFPDVEDESDGHH